MAEETKAGHYAPHDTEAATLDATVSSTHMVGADGDAGGAAAPVTVAEGASRVEQLLALADQRKTMEHEIADISSELATMGVGPRGGLVDAEGFPRADIDIMKVRALRHRLACLHTDHAVLTRKMEKMLLEEHEATRDVHEATTGSSAQPTANVPWNMEDATVAAALAEESGESSSDAVFAPPAFSLSSLAIAVAHSVAPGSPADVDGLMAADEILQFGTVNAHNSSSLESVAAVVRHHVNKPIPIIVRRGSTLVHLTVTPRSWSGPGTLGVHFLPAA